MWTFTFKKMPFIFLQEHNHDLSLRCLYLGENSLRLPGPKIRLALNMSCLHILSKNTWEHSPWSVVQNFWRVGPFPHLFITHIVGYLSPSPLHGGLDLGSRSPVGDGYINEGDAFVWELVDKREEVLCAVWRSFAGNWSVAVNCLSLLPSCVRENYINRDFTILPLSPTGGFYTKNSYLLTSRISSLQRSPRELISSWLTLHPLTCHSVIGTSSGSSPWWFLGSGVMGCSLTLLGRKSSGGFWWSALENGILVSSHSCKVSVYVFPLDNGCLLSFTVTLCAYRKYPSHFLLLS